MKFTLSTFALFIVLTSFSQNPLDEGNRILGGGVSFSRNEIDNPLQGYNYKRDWNSTFSRTSFSPYYGRLYQDNKMIGIRFNVNSTLAEQEFSDADYSGVNEIKTLSFGFGGFIRKYFRATEDFGVFLESGLNLNRTIRSSLYLEAHFDENRSDRNIRNREEAKGYQILADSRLGLYYFLFPQMSIETNLLSLSMSYSMEDIEFNNANSEEIFEDEGDSSNIDLNLANSFTLDKLLTLNYYF